jgi:hypothetical protein
MAQGLSLLIQVATGGEHLVAGLAEALSSSDGNGGGGPQILHYVWPVDMTAQLPANPGISTILLTTVYDEAFADYISDLVTNNPTPFNNAAEVIVGLKDLIPVESAENLPKFIKFVEEHDLTHGGTAPGFWQAYDANTVTVLAALAAFGGTE